jgi:hypothetical protein
VHPQIAALLPVIIGLHPIPITSGLNPVIVGLPFNINSYWLTTSTSRLTPSNNQLTYKFNTSHILIFPGLLGRSHIGRRSGWSFVQNVTPRKEGVR